VSLIMEAIKKAQDLRSQGLPEASFFKEGEAKGKPNRTGRKFWKIFGIFTCGIFLFLFFAGAQLWSPAISPPDPKTAPTEAEKPFIPPGIGSELPKPTPEGDPRPKTKPAAQSQSSPAVFQAKKQPVLEDPTPPWPSPRPSIPPLAASSKEQPSPKIEVDEKKEIKVVSSPKKVPAGGLTPATPPRPDPKEQVASPKPFVLESEGPKGGTAAADVLSYFNLGVAFYQKRDFLKAVQAYQKVIELDPSYIEAYNNLGVIYQEMGEVERALATYQKCIALNPQYAKGYNNLGNLLSLRGRNEEALEALQKALLINPQNIESHNNLGILFKKLGQMDKAMASYQEALTINPLHGETHYNIGVLYEHLEKYALAAGHYQKFVHLSSHTHPELVRRVQRHLNYLAAVIGSKRK